MLKVIIVEDDKTSLELLGRLLEKNFPDLEIQGRFFSPVCALEFLESSHTDVIITDIKMPEMSGMEFATRATQKQPFIKIILISAYQNFDIAVSAINSNVVSYILKPITLEKISASIDGIKKVSIIQNPVSFTSEYIFKKRAVFAQNLLNGDISSKDDIAQAFLKLGITPNPKSVQSIVVKCEISDFNTYLKEIWKHNTENLNSAINNILNDSNTSLCFGILFSMNEDTFYVLYFVDRDFRKKFDDYIQRLTLMLNTLLKIKPVFLILTSFNSVYSISKINECDVEKDELIKKIFDIQKKYNVDFEKLSEKFKDISELRNFSEKLASVALKRIDLIFFEKKSFNLYSYTNCKTNEDYINYIIEANDIIQDYKKEKSQIELFNKATEYIKKNYMNPITLNEISSKVGFSTWFFCKFFKKYSGKSFTDYLNAYRINEALKILKNEPEIKISILSYRTGFPTNSNFYKNFRQFTGMTPSEYLKQNVQK